MLTHFAFVFILQKVGCDRQFGSEKVYDRCLLCGGNGSLCALTEATYTKNYRVYGKKIEGKTYE